MAGKLVQYAKRILSTLVFIDPPELSAADLEAIAELRRRSRELKGRDSSGGPSVSWDANQRQLAECIENLDCRYFLRWRVIQDTMFSLMPPYVFPELGSLWKSGIWGARWRDVTREDAWGAPVRPPLLPGMSANRIHHAYHLLRFEEATRVRVGELGMVIEFGGGYGSMCRVARKSGFRGRYVIFDLPLLSALQVFYLSRVVGGHCALGLSGWENSDGTFCESNLRALSERLGGSVTDHGRRLFMATWSLSEAPTVLRREMLPAMRSCDAFLFAYQAEFDGVDNCEFFNGLKSQLGDVTWHQEEIRHLRGHYYLLGVRTVGGG